MIDFDVKDEVLRSWSIFLLTLTLMAKLCVYINNIWSLIEDVTS